jgi:hypothetical protein
MKAKRQEKPKTPKTLKQLVEARVKQLMSEPHLESEIALHFHGFLPSVIGATYERSPNATIHSLYMEKAVEVAKKVIGSLDIQKTLDDNWPRWQAKIRRHLLFLIEQRIDNGLTYFLDEVLEVRIKQALKDEVERVVTEMEKS